MSKRNTSSIYIFGAGLSGRSLAAEIDRKGIYGTIAAFLDDDPDKIGSHIDGVPVLGPIDDVTKLLNLQPNDLAVIAMPSVSRQRISEVFQLLSSIKFSRIHILPDVEQIIQGSAHMVQTREINPEDLLLRKPVQIGLKESIRYLRGKRVLITGAGGSIGSELCRQLLHGGASRLYLFGHGENSIYEIDQELSLLQQEGVGEKATIVPIIGELQDQDYVEFILDRVKPDIIFHTAAYKHVPMMEHNPVMAVKNNVFGTWNILKNLEKRKGVRFVLISTDKAADPSCVYGASKRLAEETVLWAGKNQLQNDLMVVRFGNVLGSRGSIVPKFKKQILNGGPVTLTHPDMRRFFMTIPEAASLVLKAGGVGEAGNLYTLEMGEQVMIRDLAESMIRFYGYEPEKDIALEYVGIRPGEKLLETLHEDGEIAAETDFAGIRRVVERKRTFDVPEILGELQPLCYLDTQQSEKYRNRWILRQTLRRLMPTVEELTDEPEY